MSQDFIDGNYQKTHYDSLKFLKDLHDSPWKGMITELGFGTGFSGEILNEPGASKTIIDVSIPYDKAFQNLSELRSVSKEAVKSFSEQMAKRCPAEFKNQPMFYLAISGVHSSLESNSDSHGWVCLRTDKDNKTNYYFVHFKLQKTLFYLEYDKSYTPIGICEKEYTRHFSGRMVYEIVKWLLSKVLLDRYSSWADAIKNFDKYENSVYFNKVRTGKEVKMIDVLEGPDIEIKDLLYLVTKDNPLVFFNERLGRITDVLRKHDKFFCGSFNPPHPRHLAVGKDALFIINIENARKESISIESMIHRIKMLNALSVPVMITRKAPFTAQQVSLLKRLGKEKLTMAVGIDTFNAICNPKYIPTELLPQSLIVGQLNERYLKLSDKEKLSVHETILDQFLEPLYSKDIKFEVYEREGYPINKNLWESKINYTLINDNAKDFSSTDIRNNKSKTFTVIEDYIKENNLYGDMK